MAILGAYEDKGEVVIEFSNHPPTRLHWRAALQRCVGVSEAECSAGAGNRTPGIQKAIEQILGAAGEARKKDPTQTGWTPPVSASMYKPGTRSELAAAKEAANRTILLPGQ